MILSQLPAPTRDYTRPVVNEPVSSAVVAPKLSREPPPYGSAERRQYVPRRQEDYGGGGAFPEIPVAQYPLDMGRKDSTTGKTLAVTVTAEGGINYDAVLKQGRNKDKWIASDHNALVPKLADDKELERPDEEEIEKTTKETAAALQLMVGNKLAAAQPKTLPQQPGAPTYIKYTPAQQGKQYNSGAGQRIIKMQDMQVDPMEPPKFRAKKVPRGPGSPPVPVMHSPPRAVTVKDQQDWKIPPCISNWKNPKGYTIPLDKRLAADGRGLQEVAINDNFAKFTEALYVAEQTARTAVEMRSKVQREIAAKEKEKKERELRELAMRARMERVGGAAAPASARTAGGVAEPADAPPAAANGRSRREEEFEDLPGPPPLPPGGHERESREEREERRRREEIREERRRERERERRLEAKDAHGFKKSKLTRDRDRDISEKIALGQANVRSGGEALYDQRLFNQEQGMASGLASEDAYNLYDKPLFADRGSNLYRPKANADDEQYGGGAEGESVRNFKPDKGFAGVDYSTSGRDSGPVQFEKEADPFGLDQFISDVKTGKKKGALDGIGGGGAMKAGGGGGKYEDYAGGSSRSRMDFTRGSG